MVSDSQKIKTTDEAYTELAKTLHYWPRKYDMGYQISKILCDYRLLSMIDLVDKKVLNIGCCEPIDEVYWVDLVREWHALDINEEIIKAARDMASEALPLHSYSKLIFIVSDATDIDLKEGQYDVVVSFSTIDHIPGKENRAKVISEMCRVLKPGGYLVITVPNRWDLYYSYKSNKLQREGKATFGYEYQFSPLELKRLLTSNGLKVIECASTSYNPNSYFDRMLRKLGLSRIKIYFGTRFGYLAQKIEYES